MRPANLVDMPFLALRAQFESHRVPRGFQCALHLISYIELYRVVKRGMNASEEIILVARIGSSQQENVVDRFDRRKGGAYKFKRL